jgi:hypothetical protein
MHSTSTVKVYLISKALLKENIQRSKLA